MKTIEKTFYPKPNHAGLCFCVRAGAKEVGARQNTQTPTPNAAAGSNLEGAWEGALDVGAMKLRLALKVTKAADGALAAKLDSLEQGANDLQVDVISLKDGAVHFEMKRLLVAFDGTLNKEGSEIAGQFNQGGVSFPLILKRVAKPTALNHPPVRGRLILMTKRRSVTKTSATV